MTLLSDTDGEGVELAVIADDAHESWEQGDRVAHRSHPPLVVPRELARQMISGGHSSVCSNGRST